MNAEEKFYGGSGPDKIWGGWQSLGPISLYGGSGDDKLYGGYKAGGIQLLVGQGDKDHLRTDYYELTNNPGDDIGSFDQLLFGDFGYGGIRAFLPSSHLARDNA